MIRYHPLFQVDIAHDYFLSRGSVVFEAQPEADQIALTAVYSVGSFLEIFPDDPTRGKLAGHKMIFKTTGMGFLVAVQTDPSASNPRLTIPLAADFGLTFALRIKDPRFANYTELGPATTGFHRFGNDSNHAVAGTSFLSQPVRAFDASRRYVAGEIHSQAAGSTFDLFQALRDTGPSAAVIAGDWQRIPSDTWNSAATYPRGAIILFANQLYRAVIDGPGPDFGNAAEWQSLGVLANQYVTAADAVLPVSSLFSLDIRDAALPRATIRLLRAGETTAAMEQTFATDQGVLQEVQIDLRRLAPGLYRVAVLDGALAELASHGLSLYLAPSARTGGWFGVIDIGLGSGALALLNPDGTLRSPRYTLRFLNRATRWRYIFPAAQPVGSGADVAPEASDGRILVTAGPRPLTRFGAGARLQADVTATPTVSEEVLLPAPEIHRIRRQNAQWYSEIHLSNLPLGL